jgi:hypothetical protein
MYPQQSVSEHLLIVHDMECDGEPDCDGIRQELLTFSEELDEAVEVKRSPNGDVIFEIDLGGIPLGYRQEISVQPTLREILETAWNVISDCTVGSETWMSDWYATHVLIKPWIGEAGEEKILIRCVRRNG